jgi:hypothetical protein
VSNSDLRLSRQTGGVHISDWESELLQLRCESRVAVQALQQGIYFGFDETGVTLDISSVEPLERFVGLIPERINPGDLVRILREFMRLMRP